MKISEIKPIINHSSLSEANTVKIPEDVLLYGRELYKVLKDKHQMFKMALDGAPEGAILTPKFFTDVINLSTLDGKNITVSIGFFDDSMSESTGDMFYTHSKGENFVCINISRFPGFKVHLFMDAFEHELVHARDPKTKASYPGKSEKVIAITPKDSESFQKYFKSLTEFDAFSSVLVNKIRDRLGNISNPKIKRLLTDLLTKFLTELPKHKSLDSLMTKFQDFENIIPVFSKAAGKNTSKVWNDMLDDFEQELIKLKAWSTKPTLYRKFLQRYATEVVGNQKPVSSYKKTFKQ
jgi:hypothetical protein